MRTLQGLSGMRFEQLEDRRMLAAHIVGNAFSYTTIQDAVDNAPANATITVDAGTYEEQVFVTTPGLTIKGAAAGVDGRSASRGANESVVRGVEYDSTNHLRTSSFIIWADDVTLDGFTIRDNASPGADGSGIIIKPNVAGTDILNNVIRNNVSGISLANSSASKAAVISRNLFDSNNNDGNNSGRGIISNGGISGGVLQNVTIDNNTFTNNIGQIGGQPIDPQNNPEAAVSLEAGPEFTQTNIRITNNVMSANGKGLLVFNASNLTITGNLITGSQDANSAALRFEGNVNGVAIKNNTVTGSLGYAIRIDNKAIVATGQTSSAFAINGNNLYGNGLGALRIFQDTYVVGTGDATGNWWGSSWGPSGSQPGFGDYTQIDNANIQIWQWLSMPSTTAPQLAQTPRALELDALADLKKYRATTPSSIGTKIDGAIAQLTTATGASLWKDDSHLLSTSKAVFDQTKQAIATLKGLLGNAAVWNIGLTGNIQRFDQAMRSIANIAINDAIARNGNASKIKAAQTAFATGDKDLAGNKYDGCIDDYKNAWANAIVA